MTTAEVQQGRGYRERAGARALALLGMPINAAVFEVLATGPHSLMKLRQAAGAPSQSTLRLRLRELLGLDVIRQERHSGFPHALEYELTSSGKELLVVMAALRAWLAEAPTESTELGSPRAKSVVNALVEGWSSTLIRALAAMPLTLTELDRLIAGYNYPSLERRLGTMRRAGQLEALTSSRPGTPYAVTDWLRRGIAPLAAAVRWERRHLAEETPPIGRLDIEAAFLLAVPLVELPADLSGHCRLAVETRNGTERRLAGVMVEVEEGQVLSQVTNVEGNADAWVLGSAAAWLQVVIENDIGLLELGGDCGLGTALADGLHRALFRAA